MTSVTLHSTEFGPGMGFPMLAVHGWTPDHRLMTGCLEPVFSPRTKQYRRLYPDLPGMGETPAQEIESADDIFDSLNAYVDDCIGDEPFIIIGESYGGYLARALTRKRRRQVAGLALICPVGKALRHSDRSVPPHEVLHRDAEVGHLRGSEFDEVAVVQTLETFRRTQDEVVVGLDCADLSALERIQHRWELEQAPEGGEPISVPTVIMTGRQDSSTGYQDSLALLDHYPRASFNVLDRAGHNLQIEQPELFNAITAEWLDRVEESVAGVS